MELINKSNWRFFLYIIIDIIIVFALNFYYLHSDMIPLYAVMVLVSSFLIFITKNIVAGFFHIRVSGRFWVGGLVFSGIATLVASSFGVPIPIPVISYNNYERKSTIKGLKKGSVKIHEKWEITFLSSIILLLVAFIFISIYNFTHNYALLIAGIAIAMFVFIDFLPVRRFNGVNLVYHNMIIYTITLSFLFIIGVLSILDYQASLATFIAFIVFITTTYLLKLW